MSIQVHPSASGRTDRAARGTMPLVPGLQGQVRPYIAEVRQSDEIDRDRWAALLARLLLEADLTAEQAAHPVGPVPVASRTIYKWLNREVGVGPTKVRDVVRAFGYPSARALVEVGWLDNEEVGITGLSARQPAADPLVRQIGASLAAQTVPEETRGILRRSLRTVYDPWVQMHGVGGHEPSAAARA